MIINPFPIIRTHTSNKMSSQTISSYLSNIIETQQCKAEILQRMKIVKNKIDLMENSQKLHNEDHVHIFIHRFKKDLKFLLAQFELFKNVVNKLERENYDRFSLSTQMLIKVIRQQMTRFHSLIPQDIQDQVNTSRLRGTLTSAKLTRSIIEDEHSPAQTNHKSLKTEPQSINTKDKPEIQPAQQKQQTTTQEEQNKQEQHQMKISIKTVTSQQQNEQIIKDLQQFLLFEKQQRRSKQQQEQGSQTEPFIEQTEALIMRQSSYPSHDSLVSEEFEAQQKQEKKRYTQFIEAERKKKQRSPFKLAGKILLFLLILFAILLTLASILVYKVVKAIAGQL